MTSLLELADEAKEIHRILEDGMGEITPELDERMTELADALIKKVDGYGRYLQHLDAQVDECKAIKAQVDKRIKLLEAAKVRLKERAAFIIGEGNTLDGTVYTLRVQEGKRRVEVTDPRLIPAAFFRIPEPEISKKAIAAVLQENEPVPGARLVRGAPFLVVS